jgi:aconitase B
MVHCAPPTWRMTNFLRHFWAILRKVSQAMSCTPGCSSCMNSNSLLTTVFRNFQ